MVDDLMERQLERAMARAATSMAGAPARIRRKPIIRGTIGEAYRQPDGLYVIDLSPEIHGDALWPLFLHELAHICLGHVSTPAAINDDRIALWSVEPDKSPAEIEKHGEAPKEIEVAGLVAYLDGFTRWKAEAIYGESTLRARLRVLENTRYKGERRTT